MSRTLCYVSGEVLGLAAFAGYELGSAGGQDAQRDLDLTIAERAMFSFYVESRRRTVVITGARVTVTRLGPAPTGTVYGVVPEGGSEEAEIVYVGVVLECRADWNEVTLALEVLADGEPQVLPIAPAGAAAPCPPTTAPSSARSP